MESHNGALWRVAKQSSRPLVLLSPPGGGAYIYVNHFIKLAFLFIEMHRQFVEQGSRARVGIHNSKRFSAQNNRRYS